MKALSLALLVLLIASPVLAQTGESSCDCSPDQTPVADRVIARPLSGPIQLDGLLEEPDWRRPAEDRLVQNDPANGCAPRQRTEFWVAFDQEALYIAARMHDSAPDSIAARLGRRDTWPDSDWVFINLDTFNDDRNAFSFSINPAGVLGDAILYNDGWDDDSWDGVWDAATHIDADGWTLETRIPFNQLKFPDTEEQVWGMNFSRRTLRTHERSELFHKPRGGSGYGCRFPDLVGIRGVRPDRRLELRPYLLGKAEALEVDADDPFHDDIDLGGNMGLDLKMPLSSNLTLNATVNPDFGQVEVDPAVVNLGAYETFYDERRPFFVEDATIFRFGREGTNNNWNFNWTDPLMFYSRRVGRAPQLGIDHDYDHADIPPYTTILGAAKISGKIGRTSIGAFSALTAREKARLRHGEREFDQVVEPLAGYSVVRAKTTRDDGLKGLGFMLTHTSRDLDDPVSQAALDRQALTGGIDGWINLDAEGVWALKAYLAGSRLTGSREAIKDVQTSSRHYFQRPDANHLELDPGATEMNGWVGRAMLNKQSGRARLNAGLGYSSPGFEVNDLGFMYRTDMINTHLTTGYRWLEPGRWLRGQGLTVGTFWTWDTGGLRDGGGAGVWYWADFQNYWSTSGHIFFNPENNAPRATRGGPNMRTSPWRELSWDLSTDSRRDVVASAFIFLGDNEAGNRTVSGGLSLQMKPTTSLSLEIGPRYQWKQEDSQYLDTIEDATMTATYGARYIFSDLEYRQFSIESRIDWTFTPRLTLQAYVQPLFASGDYSRPKELAAPSSRRFHVYGETPGTAAEYRPLEDEDNPWLITPDTSRPGDTFRLADADFNLKSLKVNMVLRWEYGPGSTFFFVWTQDRADWQNPGSFDLGRDARALLDAPGEDIFMVKLTKYFSL